MSQDERRPSVERGPSVADVRAHFEAMRKATNQQPNDRSPPLQPQNPQSHDPQTHPLQANEPPTTTAATTTSPLFTKTTRKFAAIANALRERNLAARPTTPIDHPTGYENTTSFQGRFDHQSMKDGCPAFWPRDLEGRLRRRSKKGRENAEVS